MSIYSRWEIGQKKAEITPENGVINIINLGSSIWNGRVVIVIEFLKGKKKFEGCYEVVAKMRKDGAGIIKEIVIRENTKESLSLTLPCKDITFRDEETIEFKNGDKIELVNISGKERKRFQAIDLSEYDIYDKIGDFVETNKLKELILEIKNEATNIFWHAEEKDHLEWQPIDNENSNKGENYLSWTQKKLKTINKHLGSTLPKPIYSTLNKNHIVSDEEGVVTLLNQGNKTGGHSVICVEKIVNGLMFYGVYEIYADPKVYKKKLGIGWIQSLIGNEQGLITKVGAEEISAEKFSKNYSNKTRTCWSISTENINKMIQFMKDWESAVALCHKKLKKIKLKRALKESDFYKYQEKFKFPLLYQFAGSQRVWWLGGNGGENCASATKLALLKANINFDGNLLDSSKMAPETNAGGTLCVIQ